MALVSLLTHTMVVPVSNLPRAVPRSPAMAVLCALVATVLVVFGWMIPSQFKSIPASILAEAGKGTPGLADLTRVHLDAARPGAAGVLAAAAKYAQVRNSDLLAERVADYSRDHPDLALWGESNPFLANSLPAAKSSKLDPSAGAVRHFLPAAARTAVLDYLSRSNNTATRAVLATRDLKSWRQFLPVFSAGGAPLEATILLTGMLVQSDALGDDAIQELRAVAEDAVRTGDAAKIESTLLDLLSLGRRFNWGQLSTITRGVQSLETLSQLRHLLQIAPEAAPVIAGGVLVSKDPGALAGYLVKYGKHGTEALAFALHHGTGGVRVLLRQQLPVDGDLTLPPAGGDRRVASDVRDSLIRFALESPVLAVVLKIAAYLLGGLLFFLGAERVTALRQLEENATFAATARTIGSITICLLFVLINEPYLALGAQPSGYELRISIPVFGTSTNATTMPASSSPIDLPTLLSIGFFLLVQTLVFTICRRKIEQIASKAIPALHKLRLVENEENLFDSGLYVGIAGTCIALVLQVLGLIQANLLAAYSSNLFGIMGVAIMKIAFVRPYKQKLILEQIEATTPASAEYKR